MSKLGERLERLLDEQGRSVGWLATQIGRQRSTVRGWIRREGEPALKPEEYQDIARALDVPVAVLMGIGDEEVTEEAVESGLSVARIIEEIERQLRMLKKMIGQGA